MKKLNITKKQFSESKYFQTKYGKLEYVSESGKFYKTDKGNVLRFNEGMKREVVPMNGRKSFGSKAMEEDDGDGFTLFSYETPVARLERREDGSGMDFILLSDYLSSTTITHIHSWLIGHNQKDIPTKKLLQMNVGDSVPMMAKYDEEYEFDESYIGDMVKDGWKKVKDGAKKLKTKIGDMFNGPFRRGERVEMSGENGETVKGTIMGFDLEDKTYTVLLGRDEY